MIRLRHVLAPLLLAAAALATSAPASAQDIATAEALFNDGRAELEKGHVAVACQKFAESQRLDPSSGTLLNLAACHEKLGKTATAWAEFLAAGRLAQNQGNAARADEARRRAAELQPKLSYLVVGVANPPPGFIIRKDDVVLEASALGTRIPTDPGAHTIEVTAPGYETIRLPVTVKPDGDVQTLAVPELRPAPAKPAPEAAAKPAEKPAAERAPEGATQPEGPNRTAAYVVGGIGAAALVTGGVFGAMAISAYHAAEDDCPTHTGCSAAAMGERDRAGTRATIANVGVGLGVLGLGAGTALWFLAGSSSKEPGHARAVVAPFVDGTQAGLAATGAF